MTLFSASEDLIVIYKTLPFTMDKKSFHQWIDDLDKVKKGQKFKLLFSALHVMNKEEIPPESRLLFVQEISLLVEQITGELQESYIKNAFPFSDEDRLTLELSAGCAMEIAGNYALLCENNDLRANRVFTLEQKALILFNAIHAQSMVLLYTSLLYEKPKKGFWGSCYLLYLFARQNDVINLAVEGKNSCFINKFKQLLLFELSNAHQFTTEEILAIFRLLNNVSDQADLLTKVPEKKYKGIPCVDLRKDDPPSLSNKEDELERPSLFFISTLNVIKQLVVALSDKKIPADCNKAMFLRLIKTLTMNQQRKTDRELASGELFAVIGFDSIVAFNLDKKKSETGHVERSHDEMEGLKLNLVQKVGNEHHRLTNEDFRSEQQANFAIVDDDFENRSDDVLSSDIWGNNPESPQAEGEQSKKPVENAEFLDKSSSGFRLSLKDKTLAIKVGDPIALIVPEAIVITVVRRIIQAQEHETLVGVETLGEFSGLLHITNTDNKYAIWVLYLNRDKGNESIIIKSEDFHNEAFLFAENNEKITKYRVEKQLHASSMMRHLKVSLC